MIAALPQESGRRRSDLRAVLPAWLTRRSQWRLLGGICLLLVLYAGVSSLSALSAPHLAAIGLTPRGYFLAETAFEVLLTVTLVVTLYYLLGRYLSLPMRQMEGVLRLLADVTDAREHAVYGHSRRVSELSRRLAARLGMPPDEVDRVGCAALLHDLGKVAIADRVLLKPGRLDAEERSLMMTHAPLGAEILGGAGPLRGLAPLVRYHHERYDGGGYPDGLAGDAVPLGSYVIAVADTVDTMTSGRPYRRATSLAAAVFEMERCAGAQFHPEVARVAIEMLRGPADAPAPDDDAPAEPLTLADQQRAEAAERVPV